MDKYYSPCPVETTLNLVGNKWKLLIISKLLNEKKRFNELKRELSATKNQSVSQNVLTQNLRELEDAKIIKRKIYAEVPPRVEYSLTELGKTLSIVLSSLQEWGANYQQTCDKV